jgi:hypothetical protein
MAACIPITLPWTRSPPTPTALGAGLSDPTTWITAAVILFLLMCSGFFSGSETALTAASRGKLRNMADKGEAGAKGADARAGAEGRQRTPDRRHPSGQQPRQHPGDLAGHGAFHRASGRKRRGGGDAGDDRAGADLRRGAAQDLRHQRSRTLRRAGRAADRRGHHRVLAPAWSPPCASSCAACCAPSA